MIFLCVMEKFVYALPQFSFHRFEMKNVQNVPQISNRNKCKHQNENSKLNLNLKKFVIFWKCHKTFKIMII